MPSTWAVVIPKSSTPWPTSPSSSQNRGTNFFSSTGMPSQSDRSVRGWRRRSAPIRWPPSGETRTTAISSRTPPSPSPPVGSGRRSRVTGEKGERRSIRWVAPRPAPVATSSTSWPTSISSGCPAADQHRQPPPPVVRHLRPSRLPSWCRIPAPVLTDGPVCQRGERAEADRDHARGPGHEGRAIPPDWANCVRATSPLCRAPPR